jgi:hypothetical protein
VYYVFADLYDGLNQRCLPAALDIVSGDGSNERGEIYL